MSLGSSLFSFKRCISLIIICIDLRLCVPKKRKIKERLLRQNLRARLSESKLKKQATDNGFELISDYDDYMNMQSILKYKCLSCNQYDWYRCANMKSGVACKVCGG